MNKTFLSIGAMLGGLGVIIGAMAAHQLRDKISPRSMEVFEKGVHFQFFHALALLAVGILAEKYTNSYINYAGWFFLTGVIFFSGSLYILSTMELTGLTSIQKIIGPITPIGGLSFIAGWLFLYLGIRKS
ncbi:MAG: DUF423 domain-containing protein [Bacteroidetes bacterium]|nr:DUF423 domain-containing protein [Bacteroidota bacterium]